MTTEHKITIHDVTVDGFPTSADGAVCFMWDRDVYTGWPLIDTDGTYLGNENFASPEQARAGPLNVACEASEDRVHGLFRGVRHWFKRPDLEAGPGRED